MTHPTDPVPSPSWDIDVTHVGERLDVFLTDALGLTRSSIRNVIKRGGVRVNEEAASVHRFLKAGDRVKMVSSSIPVSGYKPQDASCKPSPIPTVIAETDDWIVIDKPIGLLVHPDAKHPHGTLVDWLVAHAPSAARAGEDPERPGIVHRLDREVSGLMVLAKTPRAYEDLQRQMRERLTEKKYLTLVHGRVARDEDEIKFRIARSSTQPRMAARPSHEAAGRAAWSHYRVLERRNATTLLEVEIFSGRSHQIRAHLQAIGHPIVGDTLYKNARSSARVQAPRLMLQSVYLAFHDPATGKRQEFTLPPDPSFGV